MNFLFNPDTWINLGILTILEIVLGIDNIVFLVLVSNHLPQHQQKFARRLGLILAMVMRLVLLGGIYEIAQLTQPLFTLGPMEFSARDLLMLGGGLFLLVKGLQELKDYYTHHHAAHKLPKKLTFVSAITQIVLLDIVFSIDSVITAVAIANQYFVMAAAIIIAVVVMMLASEPINRFINRYARVKLLAIVFVILIGVILVLQGFEIVIPHYYLYLILAILAVIILPNWPWNKKQ